MRSRIPPKTQKKIKYRKAASKAIVYPLFVANAGGQQEFFDLVPRDRPYEEEYRWIYLRGGVGSGKSRAGSAFCEAKTRLHPGHRGLITAQSFPQLRDSTLVALAEFCLEYGHKLEPMDVTPNETARKIARRQACRINGTDVLVRSIDAFTGVSELSEESARGMEVAWVWYDEASYGQKQGFDTLNTRLRWTKDNFFCHGVITSSINKNNPYNYTYDYFDDPSRSEDLKEIHKTIPLSTSENVEHLGEFYERSLRASLTPELIKIELEGEYAMVAKGKVFSYFNREQHLGQITIDPQQTVFVSFDFNHNPSTCIVGQLREIGNAKVLYLHKEFYLRNANTFISSDRVAKYLNQIKAQSVWVFGDASGNQKTANSNVSNWNIVWDAFRKHGINGTRRYPNANPSVIDTVNAVNALFNHNRLFVDRTCKETIKDLELLVWKEGSDPPKIDKSNIERSHTADIVRYMVHGLFPITAPVRPKKATWTF